MTSPEAVHTEAAVAPVAKRGSGNASVHVLYATPGSQLAQEKHAVESTGAPLILGPDHPLSQQAYQNQQAPGPGGTPVSGGVAGSDGASGSGGTPGS